MRKILIVDDVKEYLEALSRALSGEYEVIKASSLNEAKEKLSPDIDIALVDIRLSEVDYANRDGIIFLSYIREHYPDIPVIMMSAYRDFDAAVEALNLGAKYYVKKPINLPELKEKIRELVKSKTDR